MTNSPPVTRYGRVLLKLSGEALMGNGQYGIETDFLGRMADEIAEVHIMGVEMCLVIGGGNIFRGIAGVDMKIERTTADHMGMLATVMNALAMQSALESRDIHTRVLSAIPMDTICEPYIRRRAVRHLEKGRVVIFAAGTGSPYFTTDTAAALRATEMRCNILLKGTQVDAVYDRDPKTNPDATRYETLTHQQVLERNLKVMDTSAIALTRDSNLPIMVFSIHEKGNLRDVITGHGHGTYIFTE